MVLIANCQEYFKQVNVTSYVKGLEKSNDSLRTVVLGLNSSVMDLNALIGQKNAQIQSINLLSVSQAAQIVDLQNKLANCVTPIQKPTYTNTWDGNNGIAKFDKAISGDASITYGYMAGGIRTVRFVNHAAHRSELHSGRDGFFTGAPVKEGDIVAFSWSEMWPVLNYAYFTTFQWRDLDWSIPGGPVIEFDMIGTSRILGQVNGQIIRIGDGDAARAIILKDQKPGVWYKFIVLMKYAKDNSGWVKVWASDKDLNYSTPVFEYSGFTMYSDIHLNPNGRPDDLDHSHWPQLRFGVYQWTAPYLEQERLIGPLKINVGFGGIEGFNTVK